MTDEPRYIRDLRALTRATPTMQHIEELEEELYGNAE